MKSYERNMKIHRYKDSLDAILSRNSAPSVTSNYPRRYNTANEEQIKGDLYQPPRKGPGKVLEMERNK